MFKGGAYEALQNVRCCAVTAQSTADRYADQFECQHSKATEFQKYRPRFAGVAAQRHCREMLRHYTTEARGGQALADYHRNVADQWRANFR